MGRTSLVAVAFLVLAAGCGGPDGSEGSENPTKPTTDSTLVDYGDDGITVANAADADKLTGAPEDFKSFIVADLQRQQDSNDEGCAEKPEIHVAKVDTRGWAAGGSFIPQCGGNATLWAKVAGGWREVWGGQTLPDCAVLEKFRFPASVAGTECGTADGGTRSYQS
jgi:hypothetical protein